MKMISITEFQNATGLSNDSLVWLIKNNKLQMECIKNKGLMIEADQIDKNELVESMLKNEVAELVEQKDIIKERFAIIIEEKLEAILDLATSKM